MDELELKMDANGIMKSEATRKELADYVKQIFQRYLDQKTHNYRNVFSCILEVPYKKSVLPIVEMKWAVLHDE